MQYWLTFKVIPCIPQENLRHSFLVNISQYVHSKSSIKPPRLILFISATLEAGWGSLAKMMIHVFSIKTTVAFSSSVVRASNLVLGGS